MMLLFSSRPKGLNLSTSISGPELILAKCKRFDDSTKFGLEVVKAFSSTVNDEGATRGLVATTSALTGGARKY